MLTGDIPPNQTIYIKNLNEKVNKEELKRSLYALFSQYGRILDIDALKTTKLRGQSSSRQGKPSTQESAVAPNSILFIQNLPHETTDTTLEVLFKPYPGFREIRMIDAKPGIAFVEFEDDIQSAIAMEALRGFKITPQNPMAITYAKK